MNEFTPPLSHLVSLSVQEASYWLLWSLVGELDRTLKLLTGNRYVLTQSGLVHALPSF